MCFEPKLSIPHRMNSHHSQMNLIFIFSSVMKTNYEIPEVPMKRSEVSSDKKKKSNAKKHLLIRKGN